MGPDCWDCCDCCGCCCCCCLDAGCNGADDKDDGTGCETERAWAIGADEDGRDALDGRADIPAGVVDVGLGFRGKIVEVDREGPNLEATKACLSKNFLYSYLARAKCERWSNERNQITKSTRTSNVLLQFTISFILDQHQWRRVAKLIGIVNGIRIQVAHFLHPLEQCPRISQNYTTLVVTANALQVAPLSTSLKSSFS